MEDIKGWLEAISLIVGFAVLIGALKQGQKDQKEQLEKGQKALEIQTSRIDGKLDTMSTAISSLQSASQLHGEQITNIRKGQEISERDLSISLDEVKGGLNRQSRKTNQLDKWRTAADQELKKLDSGWTPPQND